MLYRAHYQTPMGNLILEPHDSALTRAYFSHIKKDTNETARILEDSKHWLDSYFAHVRSHKVPKLNPAGTSFQKRVWHELIKIPYGETLTYGELAKTLHTSPRAIGQAVSKNPLLLFIPCHRIVGKHVIIGGFSAGIDKKLWLLKHEKED